MGSLRELAEKKLAEQKAKESSKEPEIQKTPVLIEVSKGILTKKSDPLHILNEENLFIFIKQTNKTKKYEMKHRFYNSTSLEISEMVEKLIKEEKLERFKHGWIGIKENKNLKE